MTNWLYCPECKATLDDTLEFPACPDGHFIKYQNVASTTILLAVYKNELLFLKRAHEPKKGTWHLPAGFCNIDESLEDAIARETIEETGIVIDKSNLQYIGSFPSSYGDQNQTRNLGAAFLYEFQERPVVTIDEESLEYRWFQLNETPSDIGFADIIAAVSRLKQLRL